MLKAPKCIEIEAISLLESPWRFAQMFALATSTVYNAGHDQSNLVHATLEALGRECRKLLDLDVLLIYGRQSQPQDHGEILCPVPAKLQALQSCAARVNGELHRRASDKRLILLSGDFGASVLIEALTHRLDYGFPLASRITGMVFWTDVRCTGIDEKYKIRSDGTPLEELTGVSTTFAGRINWNLRNFSRQRWPYCAVEIVPGQDAYSSSLQYPGASPLTWAYQLRGLNSSERSFLPSSLYCGKEDLEDCVCWTTAQLVRVSPQHRQHSLEDADPSSDLKASHNRVGRIIASRLADVDIRQRTTLAQALEWTLHSRRPLKPCELLEALSIKTKLDKHTVPELESGPPFKLSNEEDLVELCRNILTVTEDGTLSFLDRGAWSYLTIAGAEVLGLRPAEKVHETMTAVCFQRLSCVSPQAFLTPWMSSGKGIQGEPIQYSFSEYALLFWLEHFRLTGSDSRFLPYLLHHTIQNLVESEDVAYSDLSGRELWQRKIDTGLRVCCLLDAEVLGRTYIDMGASFCTASIGAGETMLHVAVMNQSLEVTRLLVEKGADVEGRLRVGDAMARCTSRTPLHVASARGHLSVIKVLVSAGANLNASTMFTGKTALQLAVEFDHEEIVNYLLDCGASSTMLDSELGRLVRLARKCGHTRVLRLLSQRSLARTAVMDGASRHRSREEANDLEGFCAKLQDLSFHEDEVSDEEDQFLQEHEPDGMLSSQSSPQLKDSDASVSSDGDSWLCIELADCDAEIFRKA